MIAIEKLLRMKQEELEKLMEHIENSRVEDVAGGLRVVRDKKFFSYYHYIPEKKDEFPHGKYIPRGKMAFAHILAQRDYDEKVYGWAKSCHAKIRALLEVYRDNKCQEFYEKLTEGRKLLVSPYELPEDTFVENWLHTDYKGKELRPEEKFFTTENGEKVRSKSEKILADLLLKNHLPYRYECPLSLKSYGVVYPDFTVLNRRTRAVWYWEHLGMMDNPEYVQKAIRKIRTYEQNQIFLGKQLIVSFEAHNDFDLKEAKSLIQEYLM